MKSLQFALLVILVLASVVFMQAGLTQYPAYVSWDMDLITAIDLLRLHAGEIPLHINHPGLGMYLILYPYFLFGQILQMISAGTFEQISQFANPLIPIAETVDWVRFLNGFLVVLMALFTLLGVRKLIDKSQGWMGFWIGVFAFLSVIFSTSLWQFHLATNRTELFSLFYLSGAFYFATAWLTGGSQKNYWVLMSFLALAFLTKIQALLLILFFIVVAEVRVPQVFHETTKCLRWFIVSMSLCFVILLMSSVFVAIPSNFADFAKYYAFNIFFVLFAGGFILFFVNEKYGFVLNAFVQKPCQTLRLVQSQTQFLAKVSTFGLKKPFFFSVTAFAGVTTLFLCSHFLLLSGSAALSYLLYSFKILFLRVSNYNTVSKNFEFYLDNIQWNFNYHGLSVLAILVLAVLFAFAVSKKKKNNFFLLIGFALMLLNLVFGTRPIKQDAIWNELFCIWFVPTMAYLIYDFKFLRNSLLVVYFVVLSAWKVAALPQGTPFVSEHRQHWYMDSQRYLSTVYFSSPNEYEDPYMRTIHNPLELKSPALRKAFLQQAEVHRDMKSLGERLWISPRFQMQNVSVVENQWKTPNRLMASGTILGRSETENVELYFENNRDYLLLVKDLSSLLQIPKCFNMQNVISLVDHQGISWNAVALAPDYLGICRIQFKTNQTLYVLSYDRMGVFE